MNKNVALITENTFQRCFVVTIDGRETKERNTIKAALKVVRDAKLTRYTIKTDSYVITDTDKVYTVTVPCSFRSFQDDKKCRADAEYTCSKCGESRCEMHLESLGFDAQPDGSEICEECRQGASK